jgi:hypothetical protein
VIGAAAAQVGLVAGRGIRLRRCLADRAAQQAVWIEKDTLIGKDVEVEEAIVGGGRFHQVGRA